MGNHVFACSCGRPLQADFVESVIPGGVMSWGGGGVIVLYRCECAPGAEHTRRYFAMPDAISRVTKGDGVPYRNPVPLVPVPADHPGMKEWRAFIDKHGHDVGAFLAAING